MNAERVQRVVVTEPALDLVAEEPRDDARCETDDERAFRVNESASRRDHDESSHCAGAES